MHSGKLPSIPHIFWSGHAEPPGLKTAWDGPQAHSGQEFLAPMAAANQGFIANMPRLLKSR
jgi:hypothetical protein